MATAATRHRKRRRCPKGRTLHLIDIENLCGGTAAGELAVAGALQRYRRTITVAEDDLVVIGSGPTFAVAAKTAWPGARLVLGHGVDGADRAILAANDPAFVAQRFDRVVIASGDHAFAKLVIDLRARGHRRVRRHPGRPEREREPAPPHLLPAACRLSVTPPA